MFAINNIKSSFVRFNNYKIFCPSLEKTKEVNKVDCIDVVGVKQSIESFEFSKSRLTSGIRCYHSMPEVQQKEKL